MPDNPAPPGGEICVIEASDGVILRGARWQPSEGKAARGTVVICPGRSEWIEKYFEVVGDLRDRGFHVVAFDWRGQGGSVRQLKNPRKGHVEDFAEYGLDMDAVVQQVLIPHCPKPWFGLAHSMGGAILLMLARRGHDAFERVVLSAPMLDIHGLKYPRFLRLLARGLNAIGLGRAFVPGGSSSNGHLHPFAGNVLTSDERRYKRSLNMMAHHPQLGLGSPTVAWIHAAFRRMDGLMDPEVPRHIITPILIIACGADKVVDTPTTERFAARLKAGRFITIPYAQHEIMMERDALRDQFWAAFDAFIPGKRQELEQFRTEHADKV
ncbi:alpha/beta hydrolase [Methylovirgula sp. 4M-Z18]|nr:alpha/beta hydrolase [Methylovirgula sp. 4M-Z18]